LIYVELIMLIGSIPVFTTIFDHDNFKYVGIGSTIFTIFVFIPYFSLLALKYILDFIGLYNKIINMKIAECPENSRIIKTGKSLIENIRDAIAVILGIMIGISMFVLVAEMIYFDVPYEPA